jgi:HD-like signal output (HDOD) protein
MPQSALRILEVSRDPEAGPAELAIPIETDPGLTVQVLKFVNSSYFGFPNEISNVKQAISLVGTRTVKNFALYSAVFSLIPNPRCRHFDLRRLWQDSLRRALFARRMARLLETEAAEESFAAALLQDMAIPLLAKEVPDTYEKLFGTRQEDARARLSLLEDHVFGWTHADAAGLMARNWKLPDAFSNLIEHHLEIDKWMACAQQEPGKLAVAMSALLPSLSENGWIESKQFAEGFQRICPPEVTDIRDVFADVDAEFAEFAPILKIPPASATLVDTYEQTAGQSDAE